MRLPAISAWLIAAAAAVLYLAPPLPGLAPQAQHAAALVLLTVGLWALGSLPEHLTGLIFFLLAMVLDIAPAQVVFSGFASATLWLVLGGLILAEAVSRTGLAVRLAGALFARFTHSYWQLVAAVVLASVALSFVMPATVGRVLLLLPIVGALAERVGFARDSDGYRGLNLAALMATYQCGTAVLPANAPNLVLAGSAEALYGVRITYAEYLWVQFPVMGALKAAAIIGFVCWLFPASVRPLARVAPPGPLTPEQRRMAAILVGALGLWASDFAHGIQPGWIALAAAIACLLPRAGVMPAGAFGEVRLGPCFYVAATLGLGLLIQSTGLSEALATLARAALPLAPGSDFANFTMLSLLSILVGLFTTNPAQPAVLAPLAAELAAATGWPLKTLLMTIAVGFTTLLLPHQVPPVVVGMQVAGLAASAVLRLALPLALFAVVVLLPLHFLWWRLIGYFG